MKRYAVLIGNTNGLPGINKDLEDFEKFLNSDIGGAWDSSEIYKDYNVRKNNLVDIFFNLKKYSLDYFIFYFSGHGALDRTSNFTKLVLNKNNECIDESQVNCIAPRQLNIFDCCRAIPETSENLITCSAQFSTEELRINSRKIYDARIMQAEKQQINLYACSKGEYANATGKGSVYTQQLISAANRLSSTSLVTVLACHNSAYQLTVDGAKNQRPDFYTTKQNLPENKQLILAISKKLDRQLYG